MRTVHVIMPVVMHAGWWSYMACRHMQAYVPDAVAPWRGGEICSWCLTDAHVQVAATQGERTVEVVEGEQFSQLDPDAAAQLTQHPM